MSVFDITTPAGSEAANQGDDRIRELKAALLDALRSGGTEGDESVFPGSAPSTAPVHRYRGLKGSAAARPPAGQYGLFFNTTRNVLQRDNGSSWDDIGTMIPPGTIMTFFQAAVPTGWTQVTTQNDKVLRVVNDTTGGNTGGTTGISTGIFHTVLAHVHGLPDSTHSHVLTNAGTESGVNTLLSSAFRVGVDNSTGDTSPMITPIALGGGTLMRKTATTNSQGGTGSTGSSGSATNVVNLAYINVIICSKD